MIRLSTYSDLLDMEVPAGLPEVAEFCYERDEDYGYLFYNPGRSEVILTHGDAEEYAEEAQSKMDMIDEVERFVLEAEGFPPLNEGWYIMLPSEDGWRPAAWTESSELYVTYLK
jgi:hypothetical protein